MSYEYIPKEISIDEIRAKNNSFSPGMYRRIHMPTPIVKEVRELLLISAEGSKVC